MNMINPPVDPVGPATSNTAVTRVDHAEIIRVCDSFINIGML